MIGDMVVKTSRSGTRLILIRLRLATTAPSTSALKAPLRAGRARRGAVGNGGHRFASASAASASDFSSRSSSVRWPVRVRNTSSRVGRRSATSCRCTPAASRRRRASVRTAAPPVTGAVSRRVCSSTSTAPPSASAAEHLARARDVLGPGDHDLDPLAADLGLELVGRALGDRAAVVDDHDVVGEPVGLFEVLRGEQQRRAALDQLDDDLPHVGAAARVEAGGRLVEEQHRAARRRGTRRGRGGGACRRSRS